LYIFKPSPKVSGSATEFIYFHTAVSACGTVSDNTWFVHQHHVLRLAVRMHDVSDLLMINGAFAAAILEYV
jgi:hypothetical protein